MKKGKVEDKIVDVVSHKEYSENMDRYDPNTTAIEEGDCLYPVRITDPRGVDNRAGYYNNGTFGYFIDPAPEIADKYNREGNIIDFSNANNIKDLLEQSANLKKMEEEILTSPNNIFIPKIGEHDEPNMKAMKRAVILKHIDIDKYKQRVPQFVNDKRLFNGSSMTYNKSNVWMKALDLKGTLIIEDRAPDVPNPMGKKIIVHLNSDGENDVYEEE